MRQISFYPPHGFAAYFIKHNVEGKVLLVLNKAPCHECMYGMEVQSHKFRTRWMLVVSYNTLGVPSERKDGWIPELVKTLWKIEKVLSPGGK
jgi:hypothetical protein